MRGLVFVSSLFGLGYFGVMRVLESVEVWEVWDSWDSWKYNNKYYFLLYTCW
jgi:hypothetical protein